MQETKQDKKYDMAGRSAVKVIGRFWNRWLGWMGHKKVHREIKDRLFRFLFENDKESLLQLYNALNGTDYKDASKLQVMTIENAVYVTMKNDIAFVIAGTLNMYEHQSTFNPNMPARFLIYLAKEYEKLVKEAESSIYGTKQLFLPTPQCVVFYNGEKKMPEEEILLLSDAFENKNRNADLELKVKLININYGHNEELMKKCRILKEYARFVDIARQYIADGLERNEAMNMAIDYCIDHDILSEFLRKNRAEVLGMLLEEFDVEKYERTIRSEGREEARNEAIDKLIDSLKDFNIVDEKIKEQLMKQYDLSGEEAEERLSNFGK